GTSRFWWAGKVGEPKFERFGRRKFLRTEGRGDGRDLQSHGWGGQPHGWRIRRQATVTGALAAETLSAALILLRPLRLTYRSTAMAPALRAIVLAAMAATLGACGHG